MDTATDLPQPTLTLPALVNDLRLRPDGQFFYAASNDAGELLELDSFSLTVNRTLLLVTEPPQNFHTKGVDFTEDGGIAWAAMDTDIPGVNPAVKGFKFQENRVVPAATLPAGARPNKVAVSYA